MLKKILIGLAIVLILLVVVGFVLPSKVTLSRSITIETPAANAFVLLDGFHNFEKWSPWADKDPEMKVELSGAPYGVGAKYQWSGNKAVGQGSQEIVEAVTGEKVVVRLQFGGFDQPSTATLLLEPQGPSTKVTWTLDSDLGGNPASHYFGLMMDHVVGPDYERGLARLKTLLESLPKTDISTLDVQLVKTPAQAIVYVQGASSTDTEAIAPVLAAAYAKDGEFMKSAGLKMAGAPLAVTRRYDDEAKVYEFDAGIPVDRADAQPQADGPVKLGQLYEGYALRVVNKGPYSTLPQTYSLLDVFKQLSGVQDNGNAWEQYVDDPVATPPAELKTLVFIPVK